MIYNIVLNMDAGKMLTLHKLVCCWMLAVVFTMAHGLPHRENITDLDLESNELPSEATDDKTINHRLSTDVLPSHYVMKFVPNLNVDVFSYEGESYINITVLAENKKRIALHAVNLEFDEDYTSLVLLAGGSMNNEQAMKPVVHTIDNVTQLLTLDFETPIPAGDYRLNLKYTGSLNDYGYGFHRRYYTDEDGETVWLAVTNLEPTWARHAFPCFDEPAMKATFDISIKHHENLTAISNMPAISQIKDNVDTEKIWTNFDVTPVMSTYLVAIVVADFKKMSSEDGSCSVWARESKIEYCRYALDICPKILKALEEYTGSRHVIPKMDNIAVPAHSSLGMENWGAIIYREKSIFYNEAITKTAKKELITTTITHELAHQWFGDLVTPAWWDQVWLSEGFANYFQYFITDKVEPKWRMMDKMVVEDIQDIAFGLYKVRPLNSKVNRDSDIVIDAVPYYMGGPILRMTSHVLTENVFQTAIRLHLKKNEYGVATVDDFFDTIVATAENVSKNVPLKEYLNTWNSQAGYPVINVNRTSSTPGHVSINQTRYISDLNRNTSENETRSIESWWIPLNFVTQSNPNFNDTQPTHWLKPNQLAQQVPLQLTNNQWVIVNKQQTGFYRVNYDKQNWNLIGDYLNTPNYTNIHILNRAQLLDDSFNLALDHYLDDWAVFMNISRYLAQEDDYFAWHPAFRAFDDLNSRMRDNELYGLFKLYIRKLIEKVENRVGYSETSEDDHITKVYRVKIVEWACLVGSVKCAQGTHKSLVDHLNGSKKISSDLRDIVLCAGLRIANETIWNKMFDLYLESNDTNYGDKILNALGCSLDSRIIKSYVAKIVDPKHKTRMQEILGESMYAANVFTILYSIVDNNPAGVDILLDYYIENSAFLNETYSEGPSWYSMYFDPIGSAMTTHAQVQKLKSILDGISTEDNRRSLYLSSVEHLVEKKKNKKPGRIESQIGSFLLSQTLTVDSITESSYTEPVPISTADALTLK